MTDKPYRIYQAAFFKMRGLLIAPLVVFLFFWTQWEWEYEPGIWTFGLLLFVPGVGLRVWSQRYLRYRLRTGKGLATDGPYVWMRNPVYVGNILMLAGLCILCELPWAIPFVVGWAAVVYNLAIRFEEDRLAKRYGEDFLDYCARTPRWLPHRHAARHFAAPKAGFWRAAAVEWQCLLLAAIPIIKEYWH